MAVLEQWEADVTQVVAPDVEWEPMAGGFRFVEGPVWIADQAALYFSDIPADTIYRWRASDGTVGEFRRSSFKSNGMTRDPHGLLIVCHHGARSVTRIAADGSMTPVASTYGGRRFNSPNDVVVATDGSIWFTDPTYGIDSLDIGYPAPAEQPVRGVYRVAPDGTVTLMVDDMVQPNGLAFSPTGDWLYVNDSEECLVRRFAVTPDGRVRDKGILLDMTRSIGPGVPDGLRVLSSGLLLITGPGGVWVVRPDGTPLGLLRTPEVPANLEPALVEGVPTLFITATHSLYRLRLIAQP